MTLLQRIDEDVKKALKGGEKAKLTVLRGLKSDIKYKAIDKGEDLTEDDIIVFLSSAAKKTRDSIEQFKTGHRDDLVEKETAELKIILEYLPEQLTEDKLREIIQNAITKTGADSPAKVGLVMKEVMAEAKGKADGKLVNRLAVEMLSGVSE
jgi:uncharacterized protein YqeY